MNLENRQELLFSIANLSEKETQMIRQLENELNLVLIAYDAEDKQVPTGH